MIGQGGTICIDIRVALYSIAKHFHSLVDSGGDWDRRNRLKSYTGIHLLGIRHFSDAAPLLLDSLSTFTSTEICSYSALVVYAVLAGMVSLNRVDMKRKVVDSAEVLAILGSKSVAVTEGEVMADASITDREGSEHLEQLVNCFYTCDYKTFFIALAKVEERFLSRDRILAEHKAWYVYVIAIANIADETGMSEKCDGEHISKC